MSAAGGPEPAPGAPGPVGGHPGSSGTGPGPLDGILVADLSRVLAGPLATMTLGDLGAEVVKVEPPAGDETRAWGPPFAHGEATYALGVNRNKRSVVLDLKDPADREAALALVDRADVLVENFRPGVAERFGLGWEAVHARRPRLVYCSITGFGRHGEGAKLPGYDPLIQAVGGLMSITGPPGAPSKAGVALVDVIAGLYAAVGILAALRARESTGEGQRVEVSLLGAELAALANQAAGFLLAGAVPEAGGNRHPSIAPFGTFAAADGPLMILAGNEVQWRALCAAIGAPELADDARFAGNPARVENIAELEREVEARLAGGGRAAWAERLNAAGVPAGPINDVGQAFAYASSLGMDVTERLRMDGGGGPEVELPRAPIALSGGGVGARRPPPRLDEHGAEVRAWLAQPRSST